MPVDPLADGEMGATYSISIYGRGVTPLEYVAVPKNVYEMPLDGIAKSRHIAQRLRELSTALD